jgi:hypothetical protein
MSIRNISRIFVVAIDLLTFRWRLCNKSIFYGKHLKELQGYSLLGTCLIVEEGDFIVQNGLHSLGCSTLDCDQTEIRKESILMTCKYFRSISSFY